MRRRQRDSPRYIQAARVLDRNGNLHGLSKARLAHLDEQLARLRSHTERR
jgi:hypothetical protein